MHEECPNILEGSHNGLVVCRDCLTLGLGVALLVEERCLGELENVSLITHGGWWL